LRKNFATIVAAVFIAAVLLAYLCTFQVRFMERAVVKTWGKPAAEAIATPNLYFKWPPPIQTVVIYDQRVRTLESKHEETRTFDGKNVILTSFTLWRIVEPAVFHRNFPGGEDQGEMRLRAVLATAKTSVTGKHSLNDFISTVPGERRLREIELEMKAEVVTKTQAEYGIEVVDFGIKKLGLPQSTTNEIFSAMKQNEQTKAQKYHSEGEAAAEKIMAEARSVRERILAAAREKRAEIEADAQRLVGDYYKRFDEYPQLRTFLDELRTLVEALSRRTTLIMTPTESPGRVMDPEYRRSLSEKVVPPANNDAAAPTLPETIRTSD
jgi:membrane protease subunit HflC